MYSTACLFTLSQRNVTWLWHDVVFFTCVDVVTRTSRFVFAVLQSKDQSDWGGRGDVLIKTLRSGLLALRSGQLASKPASQPPTAWGSTLGLITALSAQLEHRPQSGGGQCRHPAISFFFFPRWDGAQLTMSAC